MHKKVLFFCSEGLPYIVGLLAGGLAISFYSFLFTDLIIFSVILWLLFFVVAYFFRDPERKIANKPETIVSPADGKVIDIKSTQELSFLGQECQQISIFMSIFSVHVNRAPISGVIEYYQYNPGKFVSAFKEKASLDNEQVLIGINSKGVEKSEYKILVKLIAGLIARRIVLWKKKGDSLNKGERMSIIKFGSRVEVYLPTEVKLKIKKGDWVKAGETIIGLI
ncbi:MAG: phosphatidylserine decarboxylase family protein, partial [Desulfobacterota bacterium]|nr:phosphatidylserine decarboxylase family protein [Thermodesulfobacteriota bacterium]